MTSKSLMNVHEYRRNVSIGIAKRARVCCSKPPISVVLDNKVVEVTMPATPSPANRSLGTKCLTYQELRLSKKAKTLPGCTQHKCFVDPQTNCLSFCTNRPSTIPNSRFFHQVRRHYARVVAQTDPRKDDAYCCIHPHEPGP